MTLFSRLLKPAVLYIGLISLFIPSLTRGLDSHHDGLMLNTINLTKKALLEDSPLPFNQYGIFWSFVMAFITWPFESSEILLCLRLTTIFFYILGALFIFKISKLFGDQDTGKTSVFLLLLVQPWTTGIYSTFLPWPSALSSLLLSAIAYLVLCSHGKRFYAFFIGVLITCLCFTRVQIGIPTFFVCMLVFLFHRNFKQSARLIFGSVSTAGIIFFFLLQRGWVESVAFDSLIYPFTYIQDAYNLNPKPVFTSLIAIFTLLLLLIGSKFIQFFNRISTQFISVLSFNFILLAICTLCATTVFFFMNSNFVKLGVRFVIGAFIGIIAFFCVRAILENCRELRTGQRFSPNIELALFSIVGMINVYPQFDQTHFWWGLFPGVVAVSIVGIKICRSFFSQKQRFAMAASLLIASPMVIMPTIQSVSAEVIRYPGNFIRGVFVENEAFQYHETLQNFFHDNIPVGSAILNLCHNSDVFFDTNLGRPTTRYFLYWPPFISNPLIEAQMVAVQPDVIVICGQTQIPMAALPSAIAQERISRSLGFNYQKPKAEIEIDGTVWRIY